MSDDATLEFISLNVFHGSQNKIQAKMAYEAWNYVAPASCHLSSSQSSVHPCAPASYTFLEFPSVPDSFPFRAVTHTVCPFTSQLNITFLERHSTMPFSRFPDFLLQHLLQSINLYGFLTLPWLSGDSDHGYYAQFQRHHIYSIFDRIR